MREVEMRLTRAEPQRQHRMKNLPLPVVLLGIQYICLNMGQAFHIGPINLSWISSVLLLAGYLYCNHGIIKFPETRALRIICYLFIAWCIYALLQFFIAEDMSLFFSFYIILLTNLFTALMTLFIIREKEELSFALKAFAFSLILNLLAAAIEYFTGFHFVHYNVSYTNQVVGLIGNFNDFCSFLFIAIVVFLICLVYTKRKLSRLLYAICIAVSVYFIYFNGARGAIYALYVFALFWVLLQFLKAFVRGEKNYNRILFLISVFAIAVAAAWILRFGFYNALALLDRSGGGDIRSDRSRVLLILGGIKQLTDSFGFGMGAGQSVLPYGINVHNYYAEVFAEYGVVWGLFSVYLTFFIFVRRKKHINQVVDSVLQAAGFAFLVANVTSSSINKMRALWIYLMLVVFIKETALFSEEEYDGESIHE